jgi:hypothetical protein
MHRSKIVGALKVTMATAAVITASLALPAASAYAGTGPGAHCVGTWKQGSLSNGYYGKCLDNLGLAGSTLPYNFRVKITCVRASHPTTTVYGGYSDWYSSASCASGHEVASETFNWVDIG